MTFLSRRKRRIIPLASPAKRAATITSAALLWLVAWSGAFAQDGQVITPKFVPVGQRSTDQRNTEVIRTTHIEAAQPPLPKDKKADEMMDYLVRTELPGPQRLFIRESESQFYDRIRQETKRVPGTGPAIFPEEPIVSKESYRSPPYPRIDTQTGKPFLARTELVEPGYVCHGRLYFEQPNFERIGWDLGVVQPGIELGVFVYDILLFPYHASSDWRVRGECSVGKCLPGDPAPLTVPCERFSVTGVIGEAAAIIGGMYLFP